MIADYRGPLRFRLRSGAGNGSVTLLCELELGVAELARVEHTRLLKRATERFLLDVLPFGPDGHGGLRLASHPSGGQGPQGGLVQERRLTKPRARPSDRWFDTPSTTAYQAKR